MGNTIVLAILGAIKHIIFKVATEKFFVWLFLQAAEGIASKTQTKRDDVIVAKAKELVES